MDSTNREEDDEKRADLDLGTVSASSSDGEEQPQTTTTEAENEASSSKIGRGWRRLQQTPVYRFISWTPPRCRWDPAKPPEFSMALNVLFGFAGCFTVANLYYSHPILNLLAKDFGVDEEKVSQVCYNDFLKSEEGEKWKEVGSLASLHYKLLLYMQSLN
jgi:hypothetical protein